MLTKTSKNVLIIDDDKDTRLLLAHILKKVDYDTFTAESAAEAMKTLQTEEISAILLDLLMPGMNGLEFCANLQSDRNFSRIPVIDENFEPYFYVIPKKGFGFFNIISQKNEDFIDLSSFGETATDFKEIKIIMESLDNLINQFIWLPEADWHIIQHQVDFINEKLKKLTDKNFDQCKFSCNYIIEELRERSEVY